MYFAAVAGDEEPITDERRLRARGGHVGIAERPLQLQLRQVLGAETTGLRKPRIAGAISPSVPVTRIRGTRKRGRRSAPHDRRPCRNAAKRPSTQELRHRAPIAVAQRSPLDPHLAVHERVQYRLRRETAQRFDAWGVPRLCRVGLAMARGAGRLERRGTILRDRDVGDDEYEHERTRVDEQSHQRS